MVWCSDYGGFSDNGVEFMCSSYGGSTGATHFQVDTVLLDEVGYNCCGRATATTLLIDQYTLTLLPTALYVMKN